MLEHLGIETLQNMLLELKFEKKKKVEGEEAEKKEEGE